MLENPAASQILSLEEFAPRQYDGIDHDRLMSFVVRRLSDLHIKSTFENVTVAAHRLFPGVFALEGYPRFPDGARVNRTLLHCGHKYRDYLAGRAITGYVLSERGESAARETHELLHSGASHTGVRRERAKAPRSVMERLQGEIRKSDAFQSWKGGDPVSSIDFFLFLHLMPGSPRDAIRENYQTLSDAAAESSDLELDAFFATLSEQFKKELK